MFTVLHTFPPIIPYFHLLALLEFTFVIVAKWRSNSLFEAKLQSCKYPHPLLTLRLSSLDITPEGKLPPR